MNNKALIKEAKLRLNLCGSIRTDYHLIEALVAAIEIVNRDYEVMYKLQQGGEKRNIALENVVEAAKKAIWFDWSAVDDDAAYAMDRLKKHIERAEK